MGSPAVRVRVRVSPGARRSEVVGRQGEAWKVRVVAAPERGRANEELVRFLAASLGLRRPAVRVVAGAGGREKIVELAGLSADEVDRRLSAAGEASGS